jgi:hypothetical protein
VWDSGSGRTKTVEAKLKGKNAAGTRKIEI